MSKLLIAGVFAAASAIGGVEASMNPGDVVLDKAEAGSLHETLAALTAHSMNPTEAPKTTTTGGDDKVHEVGGPTGILDHLFGTSKSPSAATDAAFTAMIAGWQSNARVIKLTAKGATPLWYRYNGVATADKACWSWSPYADHSEWIDVPNQVVQTGKWKGERPVEYNRELIAFLGRKCMAPGHLSHHTGGPDTRHETLPIVKVFPHEEHFPTLLGLARLADPTSEDADSIKASRAMAQDVKERHASVAFGKYEHEHVKAITTTHGVRRCMVSGVAGWGPNTATEAALGARMAEAAYDIGNEKGTIEVGKKVEGPNGASLDILFVDRNGHRTAHLGDFNGPFFVARQGDTLWFAVRGSATGPDWAKDLTATWTDVSFQLEGGRTHQIGNMHRGFAELWRQYKFSTLISGLYESHPELKSEIKHIRFAGHSLGGALAQILALEYHVRFGGAQPMVYTFGSPRVGGDSLHRWLHDHTIHYRFKHESDLVPSVPSYDIKCTLAMAARNFIDSCKRHFKHNADVSVRLLHSNVAGAAEVRPICIKENNSNAGMKVTDHMMKGYLTSMYDLALRHSSSWNGGQRYHDAIDYSEF